MQIRNTRSVYSLIPEANHLLYACPPPEFPYDPVRPEKNLMWGILLRALQDATDNVGQSWSRCEIKEDAILWIFSELDFKTPFTYGHICLTLDLDPEKMRGAVLNARAPVFRNKSRKKLAA